MFQRDGGDTDAPGNRTPDVWLGVLGPFELHRNGVPVNVGGSTPRCLLALLALQPGRPVFVDEIVEVLWDGNPPKTYLTQLRVYVHRLRQLLEPSGERRSGFTVLVRSGDGHQLDLGGEQLDVTQFDAARQRARAAEVDGRTALAEEWWGRALACWRGPVLGGADTRLRQHPAAVELMVRRAEAALAYAAHVRSGGPVGEAIGHLRRVAADEPLHEAVHAHLIRTLAATGQHAAALEVFETIRRRLDEDLGIEPGEELRAAHPSVPGRQTPAGTGPTALGEGSRPATWTRPAQLPAAVAGFTGRAEGLAWLDRLVDDHARGTTVIAVVNGTAGVGKTALVVHGAHRVRDRFPDGQLYLDLRGWGPTEPLRPDDALASFLYGLGVPGEKIPADSDGAAALYRSLLAERRVLVVLDNARDADQVRPLLPGNSGCLTLVTSRASLGDLQAHDGATRFTLGALTPGEARELLAKVLPRTAVELDTAAIGELARRCAYLPLALRIAAANFLDSPADHLTGYVAQLAPGNRLEALRVDGDERTAVRTAFDASYICLDPPARRLFRLLGLVPGADITAPAAGALVGAPADEAAGLLRRLAGACLVEQPAPGRYTSHDLLREYAAQRAAEEEGSTDRRDALRRLYEHYLRYARAAAEKLHPGLLRLPAPAAPTDAPAVGFASELEALAWLDVERMNLTGVVAHTAGHGPREVAWRLADTLRGYLASRMHTVDWLVVATAGHTAATAAGDLLATAAGHLNHATYHWYRGSYRRAVDHQARLLDLAGRGRWDEARAAALSNLGALYAMLGRLDQATDHLHLGLALRRETGDVEGQTTGLNTLGYVYLQRGLLHQAADQHTRALALACRAGSRSREADALAHLGMTHHLLGRLDTAAQHLDRCRELYEELGDRTGLADTLAALAAVRLDAGDTGGAREVAEAALTSARAVGSRPAECATLITAAAAERGIGQVGEALGRNRLALRIARNIGYLYLEQQALLGLAATLATTARPGAALTPARLALVATRANGFHLLEGLAHTLLAEIHHGLGEHREALHHARTGLAVHDRTHHRLGAARSHLMLAHLHDRDGENRAANGHRQHARRLSADIGGR